MTRFALYDILKQRFAQEENPSMIKKLSLASIAGWFCIFKFINLFVHKAYIVHFDMCMF